MRLPFLIGPLLTSCSLLVSSATPDSLEKTFLVAEIELPDDEAQALAFARDLDGNGVIDAKDNAIFSIQQPFAGFGLDLEVLLNDAISSGTLVLPLEIRTEDFQDGQAELTAFIGDIVSGALQFDGTDSLQLEAEPFGVEEVAGELFPLEGTFSQGSLVTSPARIAFPALQGFDSTRPTFLPLDHAVFRATVDAEGGRLVEGSLTGAVDALAFASAMELRAQIINENLQDLGLAFAATQGLSDVIACGANLDCGEGGFCTDQNGNQNATGFCISSEESFTIFFLPTFDDNQNGTCTVSFDEKTGLFSTNELAEEYDLGVDGPTGSAGDLFLLDLDSDGVRDALGLGFRLTAVSAINQR